MGKRTVDVVVPTRKPDGSFRELIRMLGRQSVHPDHILIINTGEEDWDESLIAGAERTEVFHISKEQFDHAATRNMGVGFSAADTILFMTQDAVPVDEYLIERLLKPFDDPLVRVVYARQIPKQDCRIAEGFVRSFNYPDRSRSQKIEDAQTAGVKAFFCSNVCACYDRRLFDEMKGFSAPAIFNEDMVYAGRILNLGYIVYYEADACVCHSHNYSALQQFHRNFDNGVSQAMHPEIFGRLRSEGEGMRLVRYVTRKLWQTGRIYLLPQFYWQCFMRVLGFRLGKNFRSLPAWMVKAFSMNRSFWKNGIPENPEY